MAALLGSAPYIYVTTRLRVRKTKLIPREEYLRMLQMSLPEITRVIQETEYKREIDELSWAFSGLDLVEEALSWNLAKEYQKVLEILPASLRQMTESYLRRWDIQNVLTILRGKDQGLPVGKIKEVLIPAGELDRPFLDRLLTLDASEVVVDALKGWRLYPVLAREYPRAVESGSYARLENELYKQFYQDMLVDARSGIKGGGKFLDYIRLEIDIRNIQNLFRLRVQQEKGDIREIMVPGGSFSIEELQQLNQIEAPDEFMDALRKRVSSRSLLSVLEEYLKSGATPTGSLHEVELALTRVQLHQMELMSKLHPFSIWPILAYLELKRYEIVNLRALARGKEAGLSSDRIRSYLVI
ncbi:MAG: V-type ATP synthase subunit C [Methanomicrobiales archaeon]|nr:V-type ATP synthase subunit C [Methanomicrobiales archaeon]MDI6876692.1 V-type ATP synthase subunit C [Methanomicrobiales archaeon]